MFTQVIALFALSGAALCVAGCDKGHSQMGPRETNVLGIVKVEKESYSPTGQATIAVSTDELYKRQNFSGDKMTLLWGLVSLKDY